MFFSFFHKFRHKFRLARPVETQSSISWALNQSDSILGLNGYLSSMRCSKIHQFTKLALYSDKYFILRITPACELPLSQLPNSKSLATRSTIIMDRHRRFKVRLWRLNLWVFAACVSVLNTLLWRQSQKDIRELFTCVCTAVDSLVALLIS